MSLNKFHATLITGWFAALLAFMAIGAAAGAPATLAYGLTLLALGCLPAIVLLTVFRGAPPPTIAQVLYDGEQSVARVPRPYVRAPRQ